MKFKKSFAVLLILAIFAPLSAFGATIKVGDTYSFKKGETIKDNLYIGAMETFSDGDVFGDLVIGAGSVSVSGNVSGDATIAGGDISILEEVGGDLRIIGGDALVTKNVSGDLVVIGGNVRILSGANVGKDLVALGERTLVRGDVNGNVRIIGGEISIDSNIGGNVDVKASRKIIIGDNAVIAGDFIYSGKNESTLIMSDKAVVYGKTIFKEGKDVSASSAWLALFAFFRIFAFIKLIAILAVVALATIFFKKFSNRVAKDAVGYLGKNTLWGFVTLVIVPVGIIALFASVFGIALGVLGMLGYIILMILATIYAGVIFGAWIDKLIIRKKKEITVDWKNGLLGVIALALIAQIPFIGGLVGLFFFLLALGSVSKIAYEKLLVNIS